MAYRFLFEVPAALVDEANAIVTTTGDAQVVVERPAHGLGFDEPYVNLTVAAHTLRVIAPIKAWASEIGATRADSRIHTGIVLHSGERIVLDDSTAEGIVGAIRRDQPWVERFTPKIGEHEYDLPPVRRREALARETALTVAEPTTNVILAADLMGAEEELTVRGQNHAVIQVADLPPAERLYNELFNLVILQRMRQDAEGTWQEIGREYDPETAAQDGTEADIAFMGNGALNVAVLRAGRAVRLDYGRVLSELSIVVEPETANRIRAQALMRNYTMLTSTGPAFGFRDPFGVVWNVHPAS
jgi:hypothetical protein